MPDKSFYSNSSSNQPQISDMLREFINEMVKEIVLEREFLEGINKKYLKKYAENEGIDYVEYERNLLDFFELLADYKNTKSSAFKRLLGKQAELCFIKTDVLEKLLKIDSINFEEEDESAEPVITAFSIYPTECESGNDIILSWEVENVNRLFLKELPNLSLIGINSLRIKNVTDDKDFTLVAANGDRQKQYTENVKVMNKYIKDFRI
jgi:hypothetical protein